MKQSWFFKQINKILKLAKRERRPKLIKLEYSVKFPGSLGNIWKSYIENLQEMDKFLDTYGLSKAAPRGYKQREQIYKKPWDWSNNKESSNTEKPRTRFTAKF
jgi:hypothetical protein